MAEYLASAPGRAIFVDLTSDLALAKTYPTFLEKGVSVITPNKKGFSEDLSLWREIFASAVRGDALIYHQATVGGSLPVLSTLRDLIATGDEIIRIDGVLSGTLSYLFDTFMPVKGKCDMSWSSLVAHALDKGYMEPDPRDDLNGKDFARKLTILARVLGLEVSSPESFPVESLIPAELTSLPSSKSGVAEFTKLLPQFDDKIASIRDEAQKRGQVVRYAGSIDVPNQAIKVGLQFFDYDSPIANLDCSQIVSIYTKRYGNTPLVLKGGSGGGDITASCVMADLIKVMERL